MPNDSLPDALDSTARLETPEGSEIELHLAGPGVRAAAFAIDEAIRWIFIAGALGYVAAIGRFGEGLALILFFATYWLYGVIFEVLNNGMTPGKRLMGVQVIHDDGTPIRLPASVVRNLVLTVDILPVFYLAGMISMTLTARFQRLGDLAAGTLVAYRAPASSGDAVSEGLGSQAAAVRLTEDEQGVLVDFLERGPSLSEARNEELAALVAPALGAPGVVGVRRVANGLRGA